MLAALAKVDEIYQAAVALFYLEDYSQGEIAAILNVPLGTVKSRLARGIAQLREILLPDGLSDSSFSWDNIPVVAYTVGSAALPNQPPPRPRVTFRRRPKLPNLIMATGT